MFWVFSQEKKKQEFWGEKSQDLFIYLFIYLFTVALMAPVVLILFILE